MAKIDVELVTPEAQLYSSEAKMVVAPGSEGDFGVLPDHSPMISTLREGVVEIHEESGNVKKISVKGGFAEVTGQRCTILAEEADNN